MAQAPAARLTEGMEIDGFRVGGRLHAGAMGEVFRVTGPDAGFPLVMKVPRASRGDSGEGLINFETEATILPALASPHVPRAIPTWSRSGAKARACSAGSSAACPAPANARASARRSPTRCTASTCRTRCTST